MLGRHLRKRRLSTRQDPDPFLEPLLERLVVQEQPWVVEVPVESVLETPDGAHGVVEIRVAGEHEQCGVRAPAVEQACGAGELYIRREG
jgi:hypothetical protein